MSEEKELYEEMQPDTASDEKAEEILEEDEKASHLRKKACSVRRKKIKKMKK